MVGSSSSSSKEGAGAGLREGAGCRMALSSGFPPAAGPLAFVEDLDATAVAAARAKRGVPSCGHIITSSSSSLPQVVQIFTTSLQRSRFSLTDHTRKSAERKEIVYWRARAEFTADLEGDAVHFVCRTCDMGKVGLEPRCRPCWRCWRRRSRRHRSYREECSYYRPQSLSQVDQPCCQVATPGTSSTSMPSRSSPRCRV